MKPTMSLYRTEESTKIVSTNGLAA
jgi:hypothetical protein